MVNYANFPSWFIEPSWVSSLSFVDDQWLSILLSNSCCWQSQDCCYQHLGDPAGSHRFSSWIPWWSSHQSHGQRIASAGVLNSIHSFPRVWQFVIATSGTCTWELCSTLAMGTFAPDSQIEAATAVVCKRCTFSARYDGKEGDLENISGQAWKRIVFFEQWDNDHPVQSWLTMFSEKWHIHGYNQYNHTQNQTNINHHHTSNHSYLTSLITKLIISNFTSDTDGATHQLLDCTPSASETVGKGEVSEGVTTKHLVTMVGNGWEWWSNKIVTCFIYDVNALEQLFDKMVGSSMDDGK